MQFCNLPLIPLVDEKNRHHIITALSRQSNYMRKLAVYKTTFQDQAHIQDHLEGCWVPLPQRRGALLDCKWTFLELNAPFTILQKHNFWHISWPKFLFSFVSNLGPGGGGVISTKDPMGTCHAQNLAQNWAVCYMNGLLFLEKIGICMGLLSNFAAARPYQNQT